jgi:hypothetical protein
MADDGHHVERLMRQAIGGDEPAVTWVKDHAGSSDHPALLVLASVLEGRRERLDEAMGTARSTRDRQMVAIADAHLRGDHDLVDALARDHLVDNPDSVLVAWIAAGAGSAVGEPDLP